MGILAKLRKALYLSGLLLFSLLLVTPMATALEIGDKAPDFTLPSTTGEKIGLSQYRGKKHVLLAFYIRDFGAT